MLRHLRASESPKAKADSSWDPTKAASARAEFVEPAAGVRTPRREISGMLARLCKGSLGLEVVVPEKKERGREGEMEKERERERERKREGGS